MPDPDNSPLGPDFERRLREALDRIAPPANSPRYLSIRVRRTPAWRLAPGALAVAAVALVALSAFAATGSANPRVWTQRLFTVIESAQTTPTPSPSGTHTPGSNDPGSNVRETPEPSERPEPTGRPEPSGTHEGGDSPEPTQQPEPAQSPEPSSDGDGGGDGGSTSDSGSGSGSGDPSPAPSPSPDGH
jgi:hypothetical protein